MLSDYQRHKSLYWVNWVLSSQSWTKLFDSMGNLCSSFDLIIYSPFIRMYFLISFTLRIVSGFLDEQSQNLKKGTKLVGVLNLYWWVSGWGEGGGGLRKVITKVFNTFCTKKTVLECFLSVGQWRPSWINRFAFLTILSLFFPSPFSDRISVFS